MNRLILLISALGILLQGATALTVTDMQERGFLSQLNRFYLYAKFDGKVNSIHKDYTVSLYLNDDLCTDAVKTYSQESMLVLGCRYTSSYYKPTITLKF